MTNSIELKQWVGGLPFSLTIQQVTVVVSLNNIRDNYLYCPSEESDQVRTGGG